MKASHEKIVREVKGWLIAVSRVVKYAGGDVIFLVESRRDNAFYKVETGLFPTCACPDWKKNRRWKCKHICAAEIMVRWYGQAYVSAMEIHQVFPSLSYVNIPDNIKSALEKSEDSEPVVLYAESRRRKPVKIIYPIGQQSESGRMAAAYKSMRARLPQMLFELIYALDFEDQSRRPSGGQPLFIGNVVFAAVFRIFSNRSLVDAIGEMETLFRADGYPREIPCKNTLSSYLRNPALIPVLEKMLYKTARTVRNIETMVLVDATGLASLPTQVWLDTGRGKKVLRTKNRWKKMHVAAGGLTSVISSVELTEHFTEDKDGKKTLIADTKSFNILAQKTAVVWTSIRYGIADKAYSNSEISDICASLGWKPIIAIKRGALRDSTTQSFAEMFDFFIHCPEFHQEIYRYRSKVEGVFSAMKRTTSAYLKSRGVRIKRDRETTPEEIKTIFEAQQVEVLAKCVVHNLRRLVVLEKIHNERVSFADLWAFTPLDPSWFKSNRVEIDNVGEDVDDVDFEEQATG